MRLSKRGKISAARVCAVVALWAMAGVAADESAEKIITKTFVVEPGGSVSVTADQGDIEIVPGKQNAVEITVERTVTGASESQAEHILKKHKVTASLEGNIVSVDAKVGKNSTTKQPDLAVRIRVAVPRKFDAQVETGGGTIAATGLQGAVEAKSAGGDLSFTNLHGLLNAQTAGGNVRVSGATGKVSVRTSGGAIEIKDYDGPGVQADTSGGDISVVNCTGRLAVKTSGGNIRIGNFTGQQATADTGGGALELDLASPMLADGFFRTGGGNILVKLADSVAANLTATTDGGTITTEVPVSTTKKGKMQEGKLEGEINGGGPKLVLKTGGGNIEILKR
jgi:hypothetical protein